MARLPQILPYTRPAGVKDYYRPSKYVYDVYYDCVICPENRAKELNLDAIHDTVHEMAKDEARHGRGMQGLLDRYFK